MFSSVVPAFGPRDYPFLLSSPFAYIFIGFLFRPSGIGVFFPFFLHVRSFLFYPGSVFFAAPHVHFFNCLSQVEKPLLAVSFRMMFLPGWSRSPAVVFFFGLPLCCGPMSALDSSLPRGACLLFSFSCYFGWYTRSPCAFPFPQRRRVRPPHFFFFDSLDVLWQFSSHRWGGFFSPRRFFPGVSLTMFRSPCSEKFPSPPPLFFSAFPRQMSFRPLGAPPFSPSVSSRGRLL